MSDGRSSVGTGSCLTTASALPPSATNPIEASVAGGVGPSSKTLKQPRAGGCGTSSRVHSKKCVAEGTEMPAAHAANEFIAEGHGDVACTQETETVPLEKGVGAAPTNVGASFVQDDVRVHVSITQSPAEIVGSAVAAASSSSSATDIVTPPVQRPLDFSISTHTSMNLERALPNGKVGPTHDFRS